MATNIIDDITEPASVGEKIADYAQTGVQFAKDNPTVFIGIIVLVCILLCVGYYLLTSDTKKPKDKTCVSEYDAIIDEIHEMQK